MRHAVSTPRARASAGHWAIAVTVAILGFLLATQLRAQQGLEDRLAFEREADLGQILSELSARSDRLSTEIVDLRVRLATASGSQQQSRALLENAKGEVDSLRILLGTVPVRGPGIEMIIDDPSGVVGPDILLDVVQELRDAGAEAIQVGGVRVVASTALSGSPGGVRAGQTTLSPPYNILAIGAADTLAEAMRIPSGVADAIAALKEASVRIGTRRTVHISAVRPEPGFRYARPSPRR